MYAASISSSQVLTKNPFLGIVERDNWELYLFSVDKVRVLRRYWQSTNKVTVFRKIKQRKLPDSCLKSTLSSQVLTKYRFIASVDPEKYRKSTGFSQVLTSTYPILARVYKAQ